MLRKIERHFEEILAGTCVLIMAFMVFFQVVMRYVLVFLRRGLTK